MGRWRARVPSLGRARRVGAKCCLWAMVVTQLGGLLGCSSGGVIEVQVPQSQSGGTGNNAGTGGNSSAGTGSSGGSTSGGQSGDTTTARVVAWTYADSLGMPQTDGSLPQIWGETEQQLFAGTRQDGSGGTLYITGTKDQHGLPDRIARVVSIDSEGVQTQIIFTRGGQLKALLLPGGYWVEFYWLSSTVADVILHQGGPVLAQSRIVVTGNTYTAEPRSVTYAPLRNAGGLYGGYYPSLGDSLSYGGSGGSGGSSTGDQVLPPFSEDDYDIYEQDSPGSNNPGIDDTVLLDGWDSDDPVEQVRATKRYTDQIDEQMQKLKNAAKAKPILAGVRRGAAVGGVLAALGFAAGVVSAPVLITVGGAVGGLVAAIDFFGDDEGSVKGLLERARDAVFNPAWKVFDRELSAAKKELLVPLLSGFFD